MGVECAWCGEKPEWQCISTIMTVRAEREIFWNVLEGIGTQIYTTTCTPTKRECSDLVWKTEDFRAQLALGWIFDRRLEQQLPSVVEFAGLQRLPDPCGFNSRIDFLAYGSVQLAAQLIEAVPEFMRQCVTHYHPFSQPQFLRNTIPPHPIHSL